jgi:hypothetical protein
MTTELISATMTYVTWHAEKFWYIGAHQKYIFPTLLLIPVMNVWLLNEEHAIRFFTPKP